MKKFKRNSAGLVFYLVNKELEKYNTTVQEIKANDEFHLVNGVSWYIHYTFDSEEEFNAWKQFCINVLTTQVTPKVSLKEAEKEFAWLNLMYGLKLNYE